MDIFSIFSLFGGLAFFLYGMSLMGSGLKKVAGGRMESVLERLSSTPLKGVLLGAFVTAVIQSSSATTVMVVGFVNSGIMRLSQAIGVIMGANIGTTATGWILSLSGIKSDTFLLKLLQPSSFSPVVALIGAAMVMFAKDSKKKQAGTIFLGFAILMYGMEAMSGAVSPLSENPQFAQILTMFSNPLFGVIVGMLFTALIQSSSASVGILQALSATGSLTYATAIPLIMGMDIGACVPVLLSSIGANKNGRRAALIYLYFNVIGTLLFLLLYYGIDAFVHFAFAEMAADAVGIAVVNSVFKLFATAALLPFTKKLEALTKLTVPDKQGDTRHEDAAELLDERFLNSPGYALSQCRTVVSQMAEIDKYNVSAAISMTERYDEETKESILLNEETIDEYEDKLGTYLVKLSSRNLTQEESSEISKLLHSIGDFERISDHSLNILEAAQEIHEKRIEFSADAISELNQLCGALQEVLSIACSAFQNDDAALAAQVEPLEQVIDMLRTELKNRHIARLQQGVCTIETGFVFNDLISNYERIADHCSNIAVCVIQLQYGKFDTHEYLREIKGENAFSEQFEAFREKYYSPIL